MAAGKDDPAYSASLMTSRVPAMISHIFLGVSDFNRALSFYGSVMDELGLALKFSDPEKPWAAWSSPIAPRPCS